MTYDSKLFIHVTADVSLISKGFLLACKLFDYTLVLDLLGPLAYVCSCEVKDGASMGERKSLTNIKIELLSVSLGNYGSTFELERMREKKLWVPFLDIPRLAYLKGQLHTDMAVHQPQQMGRSLTSLALLWAMPQTSTEERSVLASQPLYPYLGAFSPYSQKCKTEAFLSFAYSVFKFLFLFSQSTTSSRLISFKRYIYTKRRNSKLLVVPCP